MRTTHVMVVLTASQFPQSFDDTDPTLNVRCQHCFKLLGRARGRILVMANTRGPGPYEVPVGVPMFEVKCGSCNTLHNFIWQ